MSSAIRRWCRLGAATLLLAVSAMSAATPVRAQSLWMDREARTSVRVEARFLYDADAYEQTSRDAATVTARVPVRRATWIVAEVPYARIAGTDYNIDGYDDVQFHESALGNPYLGLEFARRITGLHYEVGLRPPLARRGAGGAPFTGFTSGVENEQAFLDHAFAVRAGALYHRAAHAKSPIGYDVRLGATWQVPTAHPRFPYRYDDADPFRLDEGSKPLAERHALYVEHAADVRLEGAHAYVGLGFSGRWLANNGDGNFGSNSVEELAVALEILRGPVHPGVTFYTAEDEDLKRNVEGAVALSLSVGPGRHDRWWGAR